MAANITGFGIQLLNLDERYAPSRYITMSTLTIHPFDEGRIHAIVSTHPDLTPTTSYCWDGPPCSNSTQFPLGKAIRLLSIIPPLFMHHLNATWRLTVSKNRHQFAVFHRPVNGSWPSTMGVAHLVSASGIRWIGTSWKIFTTPPRTPS